MKKNIIFFLTICIIAIVCIFIPISASAATSGTCGNNLAWTLDDEGTLTISGNGVMSNSDEYSLFLQHKEEIKSIVFTSGITSINGYYFSSLPNLQNLYLPNTYSIGTDLYKLENFVGNCRILENIFVDENNEEFADIDGVLYNKEKTKIIRMPRGRSGIVTVPEGVTKIAEKTFYNCQYITKIIIPESVSIVEDFHNAFYQCYSLTDICVSEKNKYYTDIDGVLYNKHVDCLYKYPNNKNATLYEIPDSVTSIWLGAFECDRNLEIISFCNVTNIYSYAFNNCRALTTVHYYGDWWSNVNIQSYNSSFTNASVEYKGNENKVYHFITNGGTEVDDIVASYIKYAPSTTLKGKYFAGWYDNADFNGQIITFPYYGDDTTLYAKWTDKLVGTCGNNLTWTLDGDGRLVISGTGAMDNYSEDWENDEKTVRPPWYKYIKNITSVIVEEGVTHIGSEAFYYNYGGQTITSLTLPCSLKSIGDKAFCYALNIESIEFPQGLVSIGKEAFRLCHLKEVSFPDTMETIGEYAFYLNKFQLINLGKGVRSIGSFAFSGKYDDECKLESVTIPASVENMDSAFCGCDDLKEIILAENGNFKSIDGIIYSKDGKKLIFCPSAIEKSGVVEICDETEVICERAFNNCDKIEALIMPNGVTTLGAAFASGCDNLKFMYIPSSVYNLEYTSFFSSIWYYNNEISEMYYGGSKDEWDELMYGLTYQTLFGDTTVFHWNATEIGGSCGENLSWSYSKGILAISGLGRMNDYTYSNWETDAPWFVLKDNITSVEVKDGVTGIGTNAFAKCNKITNVSLPDGVEYIGEYAFDCYGLTDNNEIWEGNFLYIGDYLIDYKGGGENEKSIAIKDGTTCIADLALYKNIWDCVVIPKSIKYIGNDVFYGCDISKVYYAGTEDEWNDISVGARNESLASANFKYKTITDDGNLRVIDLDISEDIIKFSVEAEKKEGNSKEDYNDSIYVAVYNGDGTLLNVKSYSGFSSVNVEVQKEGNSMKIIWWEKTNFQPLANTVNINIK